MRYSYQKKHEESAQREEFVTLAGIVATVKPISVQMHHNGQMYWLPRSLIKFGDNVKAGDSQIQVPRWKATKDGLQLAD